MLHNSRSMPDPPRGAEAVEAITAMAADGSCRAVSFASNEHRRDETDIIMEALLREYYAPRQFPRSVDPLQP
ncbi:hypothetical protein JQ625_09845 [Bradyrhizobium diazoefficiens]|nr:hypothetical protein [Bradyrhizobium diazoefficiens]MBR0775137.1 hypothetical protein [Bradyrhizobium diazoefficiens]